MEMQSTFTAGTDRILQNRTEQTGGNEINDTEATRTAYMHTEEHYKWKVHTILYDINTRLNCCGSGTHTKNKKENTS